MTRNIRRFAAALCVTAMLSTPALAAPSRDNSGTKERAPIVRVLKRIAKFFGLTPASDLPVGPIPAPSTEP